ncbi:MAG: protein kinase [Acidobacteriota bacterium]
MVPGYRIEFLQKALGHRYEFRAFLGRGAFATVLLVRNQKLGRLEALKVLQESYDGDHEFARRFVDEARLVASLDHPNIVKVYDYGDVDGVLWYSMQYIAGPSLGAELRSHSPRTHRETVSLAVPLLDALDYSHRIGIVHRDVKPGNIMISARGRPYLMDFGIAKVKDSGFKTMTGKVLGTPAFIAPEQAAGELVDGRSDVYSLGVCLYQLLTTRLPFQASDPIQTLVRRLREDPEPLSQWMPNLDPRLEAIVLKSLARSKEARFQSAGEMRDRLLETFPQDIDNEAIRITAKVQAPAPLKDSDVPTEIVGQSPAAQSPVAQSPVAPAPSVSKRTGLVMIGSVITLIVGALLLLRSDFLQPAAPPADGLQAAVEADLPDPATDESTSAEPLPDDTASDDTALEDAASDDTAPDDTASDDTESVRRATTEPEATETSPSPPRSTEAAPARRPTGADTPPPAETAAESPRRAVVPPAILDAPTIELDGTTARACASSEVILTVSVDAAGQPTSSRALVSADESCAAAARKHLESYRFEPGRDFEDRPVPSSLTLSIRFP